MDGLTKKTNFETVNVYIKDIVGADGNLDRFEFYTDKNQTIPFEEKIYTGLNYMFHHANFDGYPDFTVGGNNWAFTNGGWKENNDYPLSLIHI